MNLRHSAEALEAIQRKLFQDQEDHLRSIDDIIAEALADFQKDKKASEDFDHAMEIFEPEK